MRSLAIIMVSYAFGGIVGGGWQWDWGSDLTGMMSSMPSNGGDDDGDKQMMVFFYVLV